MADLFDEILDLVGDSSAGFRGSSAPAPRAPIQESSGSESDSGSGSENGDVEADEVMQWGADFLGDASDRAALAKMSEVEREVELAERAERKQAILERLEVRRKLRRVSHPSKAKDALERLKRDKARRARKVTDSRSSRKRKAASDSESGSSSNSESDLDNDNSRKDEKSGKSKKVSVGQRQREALEAAIDEAPSLDTVKMAVISRSQIVEWMFRDKFKDHVSGLFVRASIPDRHANLRYRLMIITDITTTPKPYPVESTISNCRLKLNIILRANQRSEKEIPISSISSALPTQGEYEAWISYCRRERLAPPNQKNVLELKEQLNLATQYAMNHEEFNKMLLTKVALKQAASLNSTNSSSSRKPHHAFVNPTIEKVRLKELLEASSTDAAQRIDLQNQLKQVDDLLIKDQEKRRHELKNLERINKKNRDLNVDEGRTAEMAIIKKADDFKAASNGTAPPPVLDKNGSPKPKLLASKNTLPKGPLPATTSSTAYEDAFKGLDFDLDV